MTQPSITARVGKGADNSARNALICKMRTDGVGPREIARRLGLTAGVVLGALHRAGLTRDARKDVRSEAGDGFRLAVANCVGPSRAVGVRWGVGASTVRDWRNRRGRLASLQPTSGESE